MLGIPLLDCIFCGSFAASSWTVWHEMVGWFVNWKRFGRKSLWYCEWIFLQGLRTTMTSLSQYSQYVTHVPPGQACEQAVCFVGCESRFCCFDVPVNRMKSGMLTKQYCSSVCMQCGWEHVPVSVEFCKAPMEEGACDGENFRWFFNADTDMCQEFVYKGCNGNRNNYLTQENCETTCKGYEGKCWL
jgi:hypothetical protein